MTDLMKERLVWADMILAARLGRIVMTHIDSPSPVKVEEPTPVLSPPVQEKTTINGFGECIVCHHHRRVWSGVCGWCGADPEEKE
jgi:hypothetical protein